MGSFYGKFFLRNLNLYLLQRNPDQWKTFQASQKAAASQQAGNENTKTATTTAVSSAASTAGAEPHPENKKKRKERPGDEIDQLFEDKLRTLLSDQQSRRIRVRAKVVLQATICQNYIEVA